MEKWIIGLILLASILYVIKQWFDYRKVAVQAKGYSKVAAITLLLFAFMAVIGVSSLSDQITDLIFSSLGVNTPEYFQWIILVAYLIFSLTTIFIMKKEQANIQKHSGSGDIVGRDKVIHHNYYYPDKPKEKLTSIGLDTPRTHIKLPHTSKSKLFGRKKEFTMLTRAWNNNKQNIVVLKAMGGTGKTALLKNWLDGFNDASDRTPPDKIYTWSFYSQGSAEDKQASADVFFDEALSFFGYQGDPIASAHDKGFKLAELVNQQPSLLVLDGLEPLQNPVGVMHGDLKDKGLIALLEQLAAHNQGLCLISSRQDVVELADKSLVLAHDLGQLEIPDGVALLKSFGVDGAEADLENAVKEVAGHALALNLLGNYVKKLFKGDIRQRDKIKNLSEEREEGKHAEKVMAAYEMAINKAQLPCRYFI